MKRLYVLAMFIIAFSMVTAACGASSQNQTPATYSKINIPQDLSHDWVKTGVGYTNWYMTGVTGITNPVTGWTEFQFDGYSLRAIWTSTPNPSPYNVDFAYTFDIQKVDSKGLVLDHAACFDINQYNDLVERGKNVYKDYVRADRMNFQHATTYTVTEKVGCQLDGSEDVIYGIHTHGVLSDSGTVIPQPTATATATAVPTLTPGPGTPTAIVPTVTLAAITGPVPFACGELALSGTVDWNKVAIFTLDCVNSRVRFYFKGDAMDQIFVQFQKDQQKPGNVSAYVNIPNCVLGPVTVQTGGVQDSGATETIDCSNYGFKVSSSLSAGPGGQTLFASVPGCGNLNLSGTVEWNKISSFSMDCVNSRYQFHFRGQSMDRVWVNIERSQGHPDRLDAWATVIGCKIGNETVGPNHTSAWQTQKQAQTVCPDYGLDITASVK